MRGVLGVGVGNGDGYVGFEDGAMLGLERLDGMGLGKG